MTPRIGYLLPTREQVMEGRPEAAPLLALAERAEALGYASVWVGDSVLARPRHDPLTLLAAVAGRTRRVQLGTAVLLPALRNPVLLAHQVATLDQIAEGRVILGVGIASDVANIRAGIRGLRRALGEAGRPHAGRAAAVPGALGRRAGGLGRALDDAGRGAGPGAAPAGRAADLAGRRGAGDHRAGGPALRRLVPQWPRPRRLRRDLRRRCRRWRGRPGATPPT